LVREAFRSAAEGLAFDCCAIFGFASREMSVMLAIPYSKRSRTGFEKGE
jgi:hypothetical protein